MPPRTRLATGIYEDAYGRAVVYTVNGTRTEARFEKDRPVDFLQKWRARQIGQAQDAAPRDPRGSLARDIVRYLKRLKGLPGYKAEKSHAKAWTTRLGGQTRRWTITGEHVALAIAAWRQAGVSARTIRHRCRVLGAVFTALDGPAAANPVRGAKLPPKPKPRPVTVDDGLIATVAANLYAQEQPPARWLRDSKTRARFLVLATTGRRPSELKAAQPEDVDLDRRLWFVRTAKGGLNTTLALNDEQVAAWTLFAAARAWGAYDTRSFTRTLQANGWPTHIRPYNLRHTAARAIRAHGGDLQDVQEQLGHASIQTTRDFYASMVPERQARVAATIDGRFAPAAFTPTTLPPLTDAQRRRQERRNALPHPTTTRSQTRKAKGRENTGNLEGA